jgi:hypothetical protein
VVSEELVERYADINDINRRRDAAIAAGHRDPDGLIDPPGKETSAAVATEASAVLRMSVLDLVTAAQQRPDELLASLKRVAATALTQTRSASK